MGSFWHSKRADNKRCTVEVRWGIFLENLTIFFFPFLRAVVNIPIQNGPIGWFHFTKDPNFPLIENRKPRGHNLIDCHYDCMGVFFSNKTASLQFSFAHRYYSWSKKALCKPQTNKNMQCDWVPIPTATLGTSRLERCVHHRLQNLKFN